MQSNNKGVAPDRCEFLDWNQISELGLVELINREVLHPLGLAMMRNPETGKSDGVLLAHDQVFEYGPGFKSRILSEDEVKVRLSEYLEKVKANPLINLNNNSES